MATPQQPTGAPKAPAGKAQYKVEGLMKESDLPAGTPVYQHPDGFEMVKVNGKWLRLVKK